MRTFGLTIVLFTSMIVACGSDTSSPESSQLCEQFADERVDVLQRLVAAVEQLSPEELVSLATEESRDLPPLLATIEDEGEDIARRADEAGCSSEDSERLLCERLDQIEMNTLMAQLLLTDTFSRCGLPSE